MVQSRDDEPSTSGRKPPPFLAERTPPSSYKFKQHWGPAFLDNMWRFSIQLVCAGGSGALAKTAVAPLERVKVSTSLPMPMHLPARMLACWMRQQPAAPCAQRPRH